MNQTNKNSSDSLILLSFSYFKINTIVHYEWKQLLSAFTKKYISNQLAVILMKSVYV